jgi:hypothetical protein
MRGCSGRGRGIEPPSSAADCFGAARKSENASRHFPLADSIEALHTAEPLRLGREFIDGVSAAPRKSFLLFFARQIPLTRTSFEAVDTGIAAH